MGLLVSAIAFLFAMAVTGVAAKRFPQASGIVYGGTAAACALVALWAVLRLGSGGATDTLVLPVGLPWIQAHLRADALSAFFWS